MKIAHNFWAYFYGIIAASIAIIGSVAWFMHDAQLSWALIFSVWPVWAGLGALCLVLGVLISLNFSLCLLSIEKKKLNAQYNEKIQHQNALDNTAFMDRISYESDEGKRLVKFEEALDERETQLEQIYRDKDKKQTAQYKALEQRLEAKIKQTEKAQAAAKEKQANLDQERIELHAENEQCKKDTLTARRALERIRKNKKAKRAEQKQNS